jgi:hypothetical protein
MIVLRASGPGGQETAISFITVLQPTASPTATRTITATGTASSTSTWTAIPKSIAMLSRLNDPNTASQFLIRHAPNLLTLSRYIDS